MHSQHAQKSTLLWYGISLRYGYQTLQLSSILGHNRKLYGTPSESEQRHSPVDYTQGAMQENKHFDCEAC